MFASEHMLIKQSVISQKYLKLHIYISRNDVMRLFKQLRINSLMFVWNFSWKKNLFQQFIQKWWNKKRWIWSHLNQLYIIAFQLCWIDIVEISTSSALTLRWYLIFKNLILFVENTQESWWCFCNILSMLLTVRDSIHVILMNSELIERSLNVR